MGEGARHSARLPILSITPALLADYRQGEICRTRGEVVYDLARRSCARAALSFRLADWIVIRGGADRSSTW